MATADLVIGNGVVNHTIAVSDTTPMIQRAQDATAAINAAFGLTTFKVIWGFRVVAGFNDEIRHAANLNGTATNVIGIIAPGNYTSGAAFAAAVQTAMQTAEDAFAGGKRVDIIVTYNEGTGKLNWAWTEVRATISQFIIRGTPPSYLVTALDVVGIQRGADQVGAGANGNMDGDYEVRVNRFKFTFSGAAGSVRMADAAFTAESFFGITDTTHQTILAYLCNQDMLDPAPPPPAPFIPAIPRNEPKGGSSRSGGPAPIGMLSKTRVRFHLHPTPRPEMMDRENPADYFARLASWQHLKGRTFANEQQAREYLALHAPHSAPPGTVPISGPTRDERDGLFNVQQHGMVRRPGV